MNFTRRYQYEASTISGTSLQQGEILVEVGGVYSLIFQEKKPNAMVNN